MVYKVHRYHITKQRFAQDTRKIRATEKVLFWWMGADERWITFSLNGYGAVWSMKRCMWKITKPSTTPTPVSPATFRSITPSAFTKVSITKHPTKFISKPKLKLNKQKIGSTCLPWKIQNRLVHPMKKVSLTYPHICLDDGVHLTPYIFALRFKIKKPLDKIERNVI